MSRSASGCSAISRRPARCFAAGSLMPSLVFSTSPAPCRSKADGRIERPGGEGVAEAADEHRGAARVRREPDVRRELGELVEVVDAGLLEKLAVDGRDRDRHLFEALLLLLRGDDDLLDRPRGR